MMELFDKIAVVTQATSEIGRIASEVLFDAGASVFLTDTDETGGRQVVDTLLAKKHWLQNCEFVHLEQSNPEAIGELQSRLNDAYGGVDILVNIPKLMDGSSTENDGGTSGRNFAHVARSFLSSMIRNGSGKIVNVAGLGGSTTLTRELAEEATPCGVNVNCLWVAARGGSPIPVIGSEDREEIREIILFFTSPASRHLTGQVLELNTGPVTRQALAR